MTDDYNPLINADRYKSRIDELSVIGPMKKFDPLPIPFQSVSIETESEKTGPDADIWMPSLTTINKHSL